MYDKIGFFTCRYRHKILAFIGSGIVVVGLALILYYLHTLIVSESSEVSNKGVSITFLLVGIIFLYVSRERRK